MALDQKSPYYDAGGIEVISVIRAKLTPEQLKGYFLGNIIKYSCRLNFKNPDEGSRDAEKIENYSLLLNAHIADMVNDKKYQDEKLRAMLPVKADKVADFEKKLFGLNAFNNLTIESVMRVFYEIFPQEFKKES